MARQEEEDIKRAIEESLKEAQKKNPSAYPSLAYAGAAIAADQGGSEPSAAARKVCFMLIEGKGAVLSARDLTTNPRAPLQSLNKRGIALYDFEKVEENEITLHEGEEVYLDDDTDENWWYGRNAMGNEGYFPANFITFNLESATPKAQTPVDEAPPQSPVQVWRAGGGVHYLIQQHQRVD